MTMSFGQEIKVDRFTTFLRTPFVQIHLGLDFIRDFLVGKSWRCEGNSVLLVNLVGCKISMQSLYVTS